jgi:hypothetical protein
VKKASNRIEKKSALITLILQIILACGLFFAVAWKEPNPPIAQYGIELGFEVFTGTEETSPNQTNDLPTENSQVIQEETSNDEMATSEVTESQEISESIGESQGDITDQEVATDHIRASSELKVLTDDETDESKQIMENVESTAKIEENIEQEQNTAKKMLNMDKEAPQNAFLGQSESQSKKEQTDFETGSDNQTNKIDERALYKTNTGSKRGTNEGPELQISGWKWGAQKPRPKDTSDEIVGKVICNIRVDSDGYISAQLDSYTTPPSVAIAYKNSLDGLQLEIKDDGVTLGSMGKVVFILKPKLD